MIAASRAMTHPRRVAQSMRFASAFALSDSHRSLIRWAMPLWRMCLGLCPSRRFMWAFSPASEIKEVRQWGICMRRRRFPFSR